MRYGSCIKFPRHVVKIKWRLAENNSCSRLDRQRLRGGEMPKKRKSQFAVPEKQCWHLYSLQNLNPEKFIKVVGKILKKDYLLIK